MQAEFFEALRQNDANAIINFKKKYGFINFQKGSDNYMNNQIASAVSQVSDLNLLEALVTYGYDVNFRGHREYEQIILKKALGKEDIDLIKLCLNNGGKVQNLMHNIIRAGNVEVIALCLKSEQDAMQLRSLANSVLPCTLSGQYVPQTACEMWPADHERKFVEITKLLIAHGANIDDCIGHTQHTLLIEACSRGHLDLVRALVNDCGADINCVTDDTGPLHAAIDNAMIKVVTYLLEQPNIDVNQQALSTLESPLHVASRNGDVYFVEMLLDKGANKSAYNLKGEYPCDLIQMPAGYIYKILAVDSLVSVEEKLTIYEHKLTQSLENRLPQLDSKITELIGKLDDNVTRMQKRIDEMSENCKKMSRNC